MADTATSDLTTLPKYYSKVWEAFVAPAARIEDSTVKRPLPTGSGTTVFFPRAVPRSTVLSAALQSEGTKVTLTKFVDVQVSAVISQYADAIGMTDLSELTAINSTVEAATEQLGVEAGILRDKVIIQAAYDTSATPTGAGFSVFAWNTVGAVDLGASTSAFGTYVGATEYRMKASTLRNAKAKLMARNVQPYEDGMFRLFAHTDTSHRLRNDSEWQNAFIYTDAESVRKGISSAYEGVQVIEDNNITTSANGSNGNTLYYSILLGKGALGMTELDGGTHFYAKRPTDSSTNDPASQEITLAFKFNAASKILNPSCGLIVITSDL